jgi:hypothetical protein
MITVLADERLKRAKAKAQAALEVYDDHEAFKKIRTKAIRQWIDNTPAWKAISDAASRETGGMKYPKTNE